MLNIAIPRIKALVAWIYLCTAKGWVQLKIPHTGDIQSLDRCG